MGAKAGQGKKGQAAGAKGRDGRSPFPGDRRPQVFAIVIDGLDPDEVSPTLTPNLWRLYRDGEARLYERGRALMVSETNSNHTAMMTGAYGEGSGLFANAFFDVRENQRVPLERPSQILTETLFDAAVRQRDGQAAPLRTAAVLGKEKLVQLFGCTRAATGECGPSDDNPEGVEVEHFAPDHLRGASTAFEVDEAPAEPATGSGYAFDDHIMDIVLEVDRADEPDFTFVNLGVTDGFKHLFGSHGPQGRAAILNADRNIGRLVDHIQASGKWDRSVVLVTADHGFQETGDQLSAHAGGVEVGHGNPLTPHVTGTSIVLGELFAGVSRCDDVPFSFVSHGGSASVYLSGEGWDPYGRAREPTAEERACLRELRDRALARAGVDEALYRLKVESGPPHASVLRFARPEWGLDTPRIGELLLTAERTHAFAESRTSTGAIISGHHGGPSAVPIPFLAASGGDYLAAGTERQREFVNVDIAPTVAWLLGIDPPSGSRGRVLREAFAAR